MTRYFNILKGKAWRRKINNSYQETITSWNNEDSLHGKIICRLTPHLKDYPGSISDVMSGKKNRIKHLKKTNRLKTRLKDYPGSTFPGIWTHLIFIILYYIITRKNRALYYFGRTTLAGFFRREPSSRGFSFFPPAEVSSGILPMWYNRRRIRREES